MNDDPIRFSIGVEDADDLIADLGGGAGADLTFGNRDRAMKREGQAFAVCARRALTQAS